MLKDRYFEVEHLEMWHPVFGGMFLAEDNLLGECQAALKEEGLDLKTLMLLSQASLQDAHSLDWMDLIDMPAKYTYDHLRGELLYLGYGRLVNLIDEIRLRPRWGAPAFS